jgi:hypothetical protein
MTVAPRSFANLHGGTPRGARGPEDQHRLARAEPPAGHEAVVRRLVAPEQRGGLIQREGRGQRDQRVGRGHHPGREAPPALVRAQRARGPRESRRRAPGLPRRPRSPRGCARPPPPRTRARGCRAAAPCAGTARWTSAGRPSPPPRRERAPRRRPARGPRVKGTPWAATTSTRRRRGGSRRRRGRRRDGRSRGRGIARRCHKAQAMRAGDSLTVFSPRGTGT